MHAAQFIMPSLVVASASGAIGLFNAMARPGPPDWTEATRRASAVGTEHAPDRGCRQARPGLPHSGNAKPMLPHFILVPTAQIVRAAGSARSSRCAVPPMT